MRSGPSASEFAVYSGSSNDTRDMALGRQIVDLVRLHFLDDPDQAGGIREIAVMQGEIKSLLVRVVVEVIDAIGVDQRRPALDAVNRIALGQQQFGEISAVLAGDAGDQCGLFGHEVKIS